MRTMIIDLKGVRGDTLIRVFPLEVDGQPMTEPDAQDLAARFTQRAVQVREEPGAPVLAEGFVDVLTSPAAIAIELPGADMQDVEKAWYDVQLTEPRAGNPRGPLVWTPIAGRLDLRADITTEAVTPDAP